MSPAFKQKIKRSPITVEDSLLIQVPPNEKCWAVYRMTVDFVQILEIGLGVNFVYNIHALKDFAVSSAFKWFSCKTKNI